MMKINILQCQLKKINILILKISKLYNFNELYLFSKLTFINTIKYNYLSNQIFKHLCNDPSSYKSFSSDLILLNKLL